ncbi:MAG: LppP/LprE family lipoprotein [Corynebacterium sp.]|nr:LppP/LprE family lipoprotein [Corynebacterium sp.]
MASKRSIFTKVVATMIAVMLAACEFPASGQSATSVSPSSSVSTSNGNSDGCASLTGQQALEKYIDRVGLPFPAEPAGPDNRWSMNSPTDTYDPCKDLSWIVLEIDRATGSSPDQVMFFNNGVYIGQATEEAFDFSPEVTRIKRDLVQVVMNVIAPGEPTAGYTTSVVSVYGWNDETNRFEHYGPLPANVRTDAYEYFP